MALTNPFMVSRTRRRTSRSFRRIIPLIVGIIVVLGLTWFLLPFSNVHAIDIRGVSWTNRDEIQLAISKGMSGRVLGMIPRSRWLFSSTAAMKAALIDIPTLSNVHVWKIIPGIITVQVTEDRSWASINISGRTYIVGKQGQILGDSSSESTNDILLDDQMIRGEVYDSEVYGIGEHLFIPERATALDNWNIALREHELSPSVWKFSTPHAPDVTIVLAEGWELRIDPTTSPEEVISKIQRVLDEVVKERRSALKSIDARSSTALYPRFQ